MKQLKSIIILLFIGLCSCREQEEPRYMNYIPDTDSLKLRVMNLGDTNAYETLQIYFLEEPVFEKLAYDYVMAHKYIYPYAYNRLAYSLLRLYEVDLSEDSINISNVDKETRISIFAYFIVYERYTRNKEGSFYNIKSRSFYQQELSLAEDKS
jgi:hypothetical protein